MFISEYITYDGIPSTDFGLYLVKMDGGMSERTFGLKQNIIEQKAQNNPVPYYIGVEYEPLELEITLAKDGEWTDDDKVKVAQWLFQGEYKPLISSDNMGIAYYCQPVGDVKGFFNGISQGYVQINMRCDAPYGFSYPIETQYHDLRVGGINTIIIENHSNVGKYYYPEIEIQRFEAIGTTPVLTLTNLSDGGRVFEFAGLEYDETIYVHNERKQIITSVPNAYRYSNFNGNWLRLVQGQNSIEVSGACIIATRMQFPIAK